jgi:predicted PurR-regulated permease PerM
MTEWTVVTVIIALTGLVLTVVRPVVNLNTSITRLTDAVGTLQENLEKLTAQNSECHERLTEICHAHEIMLNNHETRLQIIEKPAAQKGV